MNIEQAKLIPLALILEKIGCKPAREKGHKSTYLSPVRNERTPSFHVNNDKNLWYDFGIGKGGNIIGFVCTYLESRKESCTVSDALRWLEIMSGSTPVIKPITLPDNPKEECDLALKNVQPLKHPALKKYLEARGIPLDIAKPYIVELLIHNKASTKDFFALGFKNEDNGYEVRNQFFKGCIVPKTISFIRGKKPKPEGIHIFEGFMDYVSAITYHGITQFDDDTIVLNSLSCLKQATPYIRNYGYRFAYTWFDNDKAGQKCTDSLAEFFATEKDLRHKKMNDVYFPHKDVNAWHMNRLSLSL